MCLRVGSSIHFKGVRESKDKDYVTVLIMQGCLLYNRVGSRRELGRLFLFLDRANRVWK